MSQPRIPLTPAGTNLAGKTIIITGGNAGLGYESARQFLTLGASRLILACRSISRGQVAAATLRADPIVKSQNPDAVIEVFELDLGDYQSGLCFANKVKAEVPELDLLVCNGGVLVINYEKSVTGHERTMQVNCYTHMLICLELFPLLQSTAATRGSPSRITWVSSTLNKMHTLATNPIASDASVLGHFDDVASFNHAPYSRYGDSKLAVNAYVRQLAALAPSEVLVNNICPGVVQTSMDQNLPFYLRGPMAVFRKIVGRVPEEGARTVVYASAVAGAESNGKFLDSNKISSVAILDEQVGEEFTTKLWNETVKDLIAIDPALSLFS